MISRSGMWGLGGEGSWTDGWVSTAELLASSQQDSCLLAAGMVLGGSKLLHLQLSSSLDICHSHSICVYSQYGFHKVRSISLDLAKNL